MREDGEVVDATAVSSMVRGRASVAFDRLARAVSLAAEARASGERMRSSALLEQVVKQYVGELDEARAACERARRRCDAEGSMDAS